VWVPGNEVIGAGSGIGEVATPAAGDGNLFSDPVGVFNY
jgi:hypothetical protein